MQTTISHFSISSPAFEHEGKIPAKYTCDGEKINPPVRIEYIPEGTQSLVIIVDDPDAPKGTFDHWIVWNIDPVSFIEENSNPGLSGLNSAGKTGYHPPCPPSGSHRYYFRVYALHIWIDLDSNADRRKLEHAMEGHIVEEAVLMGRYERNSQ